MHKGLEIWLHHLGDKGELSLFAFGKHRSAECMTGRIGINRWTDEVYILSVPKYYCKNTAIPLSKNYKSYSNHDINHIVVPLRDIAFLKHYIWEILRTEQFVDGWTFVDTYEHYNEDVPACRMLAMLRKQRLQGDSVDKIIKYACKH